MKSLNLIIFDIERLCITGRSKHILVTLLHRNIQKPLTDFVNKSRLFHSLIVFRKEIRVFPNEGCDRIQLYRWRLETTVFIGHDNEFVTPDSASIIIQTHIGRIAQAVPLVKRITCIRQHVSDIKTVAIVFKFQLFVHCVL